MEPLDYLRALRRRWPIIAVCGLLGLVVAIVTTPAKRPAQVIPRASSYTATHTLLVDATSSTAGLPRMAFFATTGEVPRRVAAKLHTNESPALLASQIKATPNVEVGVLSITATSPDPKKAELLANTFSDELLKYLDEQSQTAYQEQLDAASQRLTELEHQRADLDRQVAASPSNSILQAQRDGIVRLYGTVFQRYQQLAGTPPAGTGLVTIQTATAIPSVDASTSGGFSQPTSKTKRAPLGLFAGLILGAGICLLLERLDTRVRTKDAVERTTGLPVLAEIPMLPRARRKGKSIVTVTHPASMLAESYRILRTSLLLMDPASTPDRRGLTQGAHTPQVIVITSPGPSEGKTTTSANLATCFAESGKSVLVLDCDFRRPRMHEYFDASLTPGMSDIVDEPLTVDALESVAEPTLVPGVRVVPCGHVLSNPAELVARAPSIVQLARSMADVVIVDTSPMLAATDAAELLPVADAIVVIVRADKTRRDSIYRSVELLARLGAPVFGVALIGSRQPRTSRRYYYAYERLEGEGLPPREDAREARVVEDGASGSANGNGNSNGTRGGVQVSTKRATPRSEGSRPRGARPGDNDPASSKLRDPGNRRGRRGLWFG